MAHPRAGYILVMLAFLFAVSCSASPTAIPAPTQIVASIPPPTPTEIPIIEATIPPSPIPSSIPTSILIPGLYLPSGIATSASGTGNVTYYDLQGQLIGTMHVSNLTTVGYQQAAIAGSLTYSPGPLLPPLVYFATENGGELWLNTSNNTSLVKAAPNPFNIIGVPGKSPIAYVRLEYLDAGLRSLLFIGDVETLPTTQPILENINTDSYAIKPLAISITEDQPVGIWYTMVPYGIGGDIVFEPRSTLNYLNVSDYQIKSYLNMTDSPAGISDDQTWLAYTPVGNNGPLSIVNNFEFSTAITFPLRTDSDRGSGDAVFSPNNHYVAWKEASGTIVDQPPTFHETIRIATVDGSILTEISDSSLLEVSGFSEIGRVIPLGWMDTQTLALEINESSGGNAAILSIRSPTCRR